MTTKQVHQGAIGRLLNKVSVTGAGQKYQAMAPHRTFQAVLHGTGSASLTVEVSNTGEDWEVLGTVSLASGSEAHDGFASDAPWLFVRGNVSSISGGASVSLIMGV